MPTPTDHVSLLEEDNMIIRLWRGRTAPEDFEDYTPSRFFHFATVLGLTP